jgi:hypothetical protein
MKALTLIIHNYSKLKSAGIFTPVKMLDNLTRLTLSKFGNEPILRDWYIYKL